MRRAVPIFGAYWLRHDSRRTLMTRHTVKSVDLASQKGDIVFRRSFSPRRRQKKVTKKLVPGMFSEGSLSRPDISENPLLFFSSFCDVLTKPFFPLPNGKKEIERLNLFRTAAPFRGTTYLKKFEWIVPRTGPQS